MKFDSTGLLKPQIAHAKFLLESLLKNNFAVDLSGTGTGKTYIGSAIAKNFGKEVIVICPKLVKHTWMEILKSFSVKPKFIINYEKLCRGNTKWLKYRKPKNQDESRNLCIKLKIKKDTLVLLDESHKCRGMYSLQAGLMHALTREQYPTVAISATQATNPLDMFAFGYFAGLHDGSMKNFKIWAVEECGAEWEGRWGKLIYNGDDVNSKAKMANLHNYLFNIKKCASRLTKADFGDLFPKHQIVAESVDMGANSDKIQSIYEHMEDELAKLENDAERYKNHILAIITKARREAELLKVPSMLEFAEEYYNEGMSPILFVNYSDTIKALVNRLTKDYNPQLIAQIHGLQPEGERENDLKLFQSDDKRFMVANLACGQSISMHDLNGNHPRSSLINPSYSAISVLQSLGRHDRAKAKTDCYTRFLWAARTIEEKVCRRYQMKKDCIDLLNDGDLVPSERLFKFARGQDV